MGKGRRGATGHLLKRARPGRGRSNPVIAKWLRAGSGGRPGDGQGTWASMLAGAHPDHLLSFLVCGPERSTPATAWQRKGSRVWTPSPSTSAAAAAGKTPSGSGDGRVGRPPRDRRGPAWGINCHLFREMKSPLGAARSLPCVRYGSSPSGGSPSQVACRVYWIVDPPVD